MRASASRCGSRKSMARYSSIRNVSAIALLVSSSALALQLPAGTEIQLRLTTKVSTQSSKVNDKIDAVVIAPVMASGQFAIPAGAVVRGTVAKATSSAKADERSSLTLSFTDLEIDGTKTKLAAQVVGVDNARES